MFNDCLAVSSAQNRLRQNLGLTIGLVLTQFVDVPKHLA